MPMTPALSTTLLRTQSDARLTQLAREGHERAFEAIVERHRTALGRYCRRMLRDDRADDALQQTFMNAWSALGEGAEVRELRAWLYRIARNACLDVLTRKGYDVSELSASLQGSDGTQDAERRAVMRETLVAVAALPDRQRDALLATAVQGRSVADVAAELDIGEGAARQLVHRARATLRTAMTALTPPPFALWLAQMGSDGSPVRRIAELTATGGGATAGALAMKAGAVVVATGALAGAGGEAAHQVAVHRTPPPPQRRAQARPPLARAAVAPAAAAGTVVRAALVRPAGPPGLARVKLGSAEVREHHGARAHEAEPPPERDEGRGDDVETRLPFGDDGSRPVLARPDFDETGRGGDAPRRPQQGQGDGQGPRPAVRPQGNQGRPVQGGRPSGDGDGSGSAGEGSGSGSGGPGSGGDTTQVADAAPAQVPARRASGDAPRPASAPVAQQQPQQASQPQQQQPRPAGEGLPLLSGLLPQRPGA